jgi:hypothetical protein
MKSTVPLMALAGVVAAALVLRGQANPEPALGAEKIYLSLLPEIQKIRIFDHHGHPGYATDPDVDAMAIPPGSSTPLRMRADNPELIQGARFLFGYPFNDLSPQHEQWLIAKTRSLQQEQGRAYFSRILDRMNIEAAVANRARMAPYLDPRRFPWVFFADAFLFPFDNSGLATRNPDMAVFMPMQTRQLHRMMRQTGQAELPADFSAYLQWVTRVLQQNREAGGIAMKFEVFYFRPARFGDPSWTQAAEVYSKWRAGGVPPAAEYTVFQDYIFRYLVREGGRLNLPVHIHSAVGAGDFFSLHDDNVLKLESILRDPRYTSTTFVLIHGGYPFYRQSILMAAMKNVYLDTSETEELLYPAEFKKVLKLWLETYPEKITFGTDCFPYNAALGVEEGYWLGVRTSQEALAAALAEMIAAHEITRARALQMAHGYLHDNAAHLYPQLSLSN